MKACLLQVSRRSAGEDEALLLSLGFLTDAFVGVSP